MKLRSVVFKLIFLSILNACPGKGGSEFWIPISHPGEFRLFYQPAASIGSEISTSAASEKIKSDLRIQSIDRGVCLSAGIAPIYGVSLCLPDPQRSVESEFQKILMFRDENPRAKMESIRFDFSESGSAEIQLRLNRDLAADLDEEWLVLSGDKGLDRLLEKRKFPNENFISIFAENSMSKPHFPGGFPRFSVFAGPGKIQLLFHSAKILEDENSIVIEIPGNVSILSEFFLEIQKQNSQVAGVCKSGLPLVTEIFAGTDSKIGRFLELSNLTSEPICIQDLAVQTTTGVGVLSKSKGFLISGESILYTESGSVLPGIETGNFPWGDLKKEGEIVFKNGVLSANIRIDERSFTEGGRFYSSQGEFYSLCKGDSPILLPDTFCMNPGTFKKEKISRNFPNCDLHQFQIEELNLIGLFFRDKTDEKQKFIDLEYTGNTICDPNSLSFEIGGYEIPIWLNSERIEPNQILTLGKQDFIRERILLSSADFKDAKYGDSIVLKDRFLRTVRTLSDSFLQTQILKKSDGLVLSLLQRNGIWIPHPIFPSSTLVLELQNSHSMNPGIKTEVPDSYL